MSLALSLGGTFALTLMFTVFYNLMGSAGLYFKASASTSSLAAIGALNPAQQAYLKDHIKTSISLSFYALSAFLWLGAVATAFMGNVNISKRRNNEGELDFNENVVKGAYLGSLLRRGFAARKEKDDVREN
jgi:hypothetical protein